MCEISTLIKQLDDKDWFIRTKAEHALTELSIYVVKPLVDTLKDENYRIRMHAAEILGKIRDARAVGPLIAVLNDENAGVRCKAANALGNLNDSRAIEPLIDALTDEKSVVSKVAAMALMQITNIKSYGEDFDKWRIWLETNRKEVSLQL